MLPVVIPCIHDYITMKTITSCRLTQHSRWQTPMELDCPLVPPQPRRKQARPKPTPLPEPLAPARQSGPAEQRRGRPHQSLPVQAGSRTRDTRVETDTVEWQRDEKRGSGPTEPQPVSSRFEERANPLYTSASTLTAREPVETQVPLCNFLHCRLLFIDISEIMRCVLAVLTNLTPQTQRRLESNYVFTSRTDGPRPAQGPTVVDSRPEGSGSDGDTQPSAGAALAGRRKHRRKSRRSGHPHYVLYDHEGPELVPMQAASQDHHHHHHHTHSHSTRHSHTGPDLPRALGPNGEEIYERRRIERIFRLDTQVDAEPKPSAEEPRSQHDYFTGPAYLPAVAVTGAGHNLSRPQPAHRHYYYPQHVLPTEMVHSSSDHSAPPHDTLVHDTLAAHPISPSPATALPSAVPASVSYSSYTHHFETSYSTQVDLGPNSGQASETQGQPISAHDAIGGAHDGDPTTVNNHAKPAGTPSAMPANMADWTAAQVEAWLAANHLGSFISAAQRHGLTGADLQALELATATRLGQSAAACIQLLRAIAAWHEQVSVGDLPPDKLGCLVLVYDMQCFFVMPVPDRAATLPAAAAGRVDGVACAGLAAGRRLCRLCRSLPCGRMHRSGARRHALAQRPDCLRRDGAQFSVHACVSTHQPSLSLLCYEDNYAPQTSFPSRRLTCRAMLTASACGRC